MNKPTKVKSSLVADSEYFAYFDQKPGNATETLKRKRFVSSFQVIKHLNDLKLQILLEDGYFAGE
ncbi:hypothetical protein NYE76_29015 [Paenibacillus sp. FSL M7-0831]